MNSIRSAKGITRGTGQSLTRKIAANVALAAERMDAHCAQGRAPQRDFIAEAARLAFQLDPIAWGFDLSDDREQDYGSTPSSVAQQPWQYGKEAALATQVLPFSEPIHKRTYCINKDAVRKGVYMNHCHAVKLFRRAP